MKNGLDEPWPDGFVYRDDGRDGLRHVQVLHENLSAIVPERVQEKQRWVGNESSMNRATGEPARFTRAKRIGAAVTRKPSDSTRNDMEPTNEKETMKGTTEKQREDEIDRDFYTEHGGEG